MRDLQGRIRGYMQGYFYIFKLDHDRIKFGFTKNTAQRMIQARVYVPDAQLIDKWECSQWLEPKAISVLGETLVWIGGEVFLCNDIPNLVERTNLFFTKENIEKLRRDRIAQRENKINQYWQARQPQVILNQAQVLTWHRALLKIREDSLDIST